MIEQFSSFSSRFFFFFPAMPPWFYRRQVAPNGGQPGGVWREVVTNRVPFGSRHCTFGGLSASVGIIWRVVAQTRCHLAASGAMCARNLIGATWRAPLHSSGFQQADCLLQRAICSRHLVPLGGHLALIARCKWRDENFKHFEIFLPPHSNLVPLRATTSQLGGSLSHYTPLGTLLATLGATVNCIGANWRQLAPAQWDS